jgi:kynurenine 3-monooxygenase
MVTFSRVPYRKAYEAGVIQNEILQQLCRQARRPEDVDPEAARGLIESRLGPLMRELS